MSIGQQRCGSTLVPELEWIQLWMVPALLRRVFLSCSVQLSPNFPRAINLPAEVDLHVRLLATHVWKC